MNKVWALVIVIILAVAGFLLFRGESEAPTELDNGTATNQGVDVGEPNPAGTQQAVREFTIDASNFAFSLKELEVNEGEMVRITLTNKMGMHDWKLDEFNVGTKVLQAGQSETIEFLADKKGTFEYYCSVGQHRANGMKGTLTVK